MLDISGDDIAELNDSDHCHAFSKLKIKHFLDPAPLRKSFFSVVFIVIYPNMGNIKKRYFHRWKRPKKINDKPNNSSVSLAIETFEQKLPQNS